MLRRPSLFNADLHVGMSGAPSHPPRQRTPPSPNHHHPPSSTMSNPRPPLRPTSYHHQPRYYRGGAMSNSSTSLVGWTPRTALPHRSHSRGPSNSSLVNHHHHHHHHHPSSSSSLSPRVNTSSASLSSKHSLSKSIPRSASPSIPSTNTPSWLKGNYTYRPQSSPISSSSPSMLTVEDYCKTRIRDIKQTIEGENDTVPELRKVMIDLESSKICDEINLISSIRKEFWQTRKRQRKAAAELRKIEREIRRINIHSDHINGKINRLRAYAKFIESGWQDEQLPVPISSSSIKKKLDENEKEYTQIQVDSSSNLEQQKDQHDRVQPLDSGQPSK